MSLEGSDERALISEIRQRLHLLIRGLSVVGLYWVLLRGPLAPELPAGHFLVGVCEALLAILFMLGSGLAVITLSYVLADYARLRALRRR